MGSCERAVTAERRKRRAPTRPSFDRAEAAELWRRAKEGDETARLQLLEGYLPFVKSRARRFKEFHPRMSFGDLIGYGFIGLELAFRSFDPERGTPFTLYALRAVDGAMEDGWRKDSDPVRVPKHSREKAAAFLRGHAELKESLGREPTARELLGDLQWTVKDLETVAAATVNQSLARRLRAKARAEEQNRFPKPLATMCEATGLARERVVADLEAWRACAVGIGERERRVLERRWGWDGEPRAGLRSLSAQLGVCEASVQHIEIRAIARLMWRARRRGLIEPNGSGTPVGTKVRAVRWDGRLSPEW